MQNKLQELTDKLYNEGLSKGKQEAQEMVAKAKAEAEKILAAAQENASKIIADAEKQALDIKTKADNDLRIAASQTISAVKQQIENIIITKAIKEPVKASLSDVDFVKSVILTIAKAFNASHSEPVDLELILPAALQEGLKSFVEKEAHKEMGAGVNITFSKQLAGGFKIGPKDEGYMIGFSDEDFEKVLADYIRPATKKLLFG
ncbi:MAG: hypothetical protein II318_04720 [Bacteroidales bacterium]|nr:hypothetical protein [Bacteroidales bacterium]